MGEAHSRKGTWGYVKKPDEGEEITEIDRLGQRRARRRLLGRHCGPGEGEGGREQDVERDRRTLNMRGAIFIQRDSVES